MGLMPHMNHSNSTTMVFMLILSALLKTLIMVYWQSDMALLKMVMTTGWSRIHGAPLGVTMVMSKLPVTKTTCVVLHLLLHSHLYKSFFFHENTYIFKLVIKALVND